VEETVVEEQGFLDKLLDLFKELFD